ncbi:hypothetical protein D3C80_2189480 [compost metagenome]
MGHAVGTELLLFGQRVLPAPAGGQQQRAPRSYPLEEPTPAQVAEGKVIDDRFHALPSGNWLAA